MIVLLTGGTGGAKFLQGLMQVIPQDQITCVVNTGDDFQCWGLQVSPDVDSITYALAGLLSRERGWGVEGDTFQCLEVMRRLGAPAWFQIGDRDLGLHVFRTEKLRAGRTLSQVTAEVAQQMEIRARILPMSDERVETRLATRDGELSFQEYFVRERYRLPVSAVRFQGAEIARPAPGVVAAIHQAEAVLLAPSNPATSMGPILAVPGIREALRQTPASVGAVSPIVGSAAVSGPAAELMRTQGLPASIAGVAKAYEDFLDVLIADECDAVAAPEIEAMGIRVRCTVTIMKSEAEKAALADAAVRAVRSCGMRATA